MIRTLVIDGEGIHDVAFVLVHVWAFDAASCTEERMAPVTFGHSAGRRGPPTPLAAGAEMLVPGTEGAGEVADTMSEALLA